MQQRAVTATTVTEVAESLGASPGRAEPTARRRANRRELPASLQEDGLISADQLATLIGVGKRTIFRWKAGGQLPDYDFKHGQTCRWKISTVRTLIAQPQRLRWA